MSQETIPTIPFADLGKDLSAPDSDAIWALLSQELGRSNKKIIVLDDDPTGVQTVHGIYVYTSWDSPSIEAGFREEGPLFFVLTNSRGMTAQETARVHRDIGRTIAAAARAQGRDFILISRSDSTLRGHYPLETETLKAVLEEETGLSFDGEIICPFFMEGGRYTIGNVHYVKIQDALIPAAQTEFAGDKTFGYRHSDLREWVEEKTAGAFTKDKVRAVPLELLRSPSAEEGAEKICALLMECSGFSKVIVNALCYEDIALFTAALYRAIAQEKRFLIRSAAALPKVMGGIPTKPLLEVKDLFPESRLSSNPRGGLVMIGSHVQKTSRQLELLMEKEGLSAIEFNVHLVTEEEKFSQEIERVQALCNESLEAGRSTVVYTSRELLVLNTGNKEDELRVSLKIAAAITGFVSGLSGQPRYIIAKGGITSSEIGTIALGVKKALVLGQILPGIPVWLTGEESRFPHTPYIIFPGNVGEEGDLRRIVDMLE